MLMRHLLCVPLVALVLATTALEASATTTCTLKITSTRVVGPPAGYNCNWEVCICMDAGDMVDWNTDGARNGSVTVPEAGLTAKDSDIGNPDDTLGTLPGGTYPLNLSGLTNPCPPYPPQCFPFGTGFFVSDAVWDDWFGDDWDPYVAGPTGATVNIPGVTGETTNP